LNLPQSHFQVTATRHCPGPPTARVDTALLSSHYTTSSRPTATVTYGNLGVSVHGRCVALVTTVASASPPGIFYTSAGPGGLHNIHLLCPPHFQLPTPQPQAMPRNLNPHITTLASESTVTELGGTGTGGDRPIRGVWAEICGAWGELLLDTLFFYTNF
jgi:hypothetical protein